MEITRALIEKIHVGSIMYTDGYPSYPEVAKNMSVVHRTVNNSVGFITEDGVHTNNIESFWSHLKASMRKENGILRENSDDWLEYYCFRRRYFSNAKRTDFNEIFCELLKVHFV